MLLGKAPLLNIFVILELKKFIVKSVLTTVLSEEPNMPKPLGFGYIFLKNENHRLVNTAL